MAFTKVLRSIPIWALMALAMATEPVIAKWPELVPLQTRLTGGYLGLIPIDLTAERAKALKLSELSGVEITFVQQGAPADLAGIRPGDVILSYNGEKVLGTQQFRRLIQETPPARQVLLVCWRAGAHKELPVTTVARPSASPNETAGSFDDMDLSTARITDIPFPMMLWRNLVLGVESEQINDQLAQALGVRQGILIWTVTPAYPAQHAGLRAGDVLTAFCGHAIHSPRELGLILQQLQNGQKPVSMELVRDHKTISISISLEGER